MPQINVRVFCSNPIYVIDKEYPGERYPSDVLDDYEDRQDDQLITQSREEGKTKEVGIGVV